ncbi:MAG: cysteine desulfurase family protein [Bacteroidota bacterium]
MKIYLDNAATTAIHPEVIDAMVEVMKNKFGNPSSIHGYGREVRTIVEDARKKVAKILKTSPASIFFTSGGTEANNMAIRCTIHDMAIRHAITSPIEHHAVIHTLEDLAARGEIKLSLVKLDSNGNVDLNDLERLLKENERSFVSLMHANNEIGTLLPLQECGAICRKYDAIFHCDTVQTMGHFIHDMSTLQVDFITCAAHKFHGPKGVGFLYINNERVKIKPLITGGAQERNMRGGTENVYGIVGLAKALELAYDHMDEHMIYITGLKNYMIKKLMDEIPGVSFNGETGKKSLYTVLNVSLPSTEIGEMLLFNLDIAGIAASGGSACSSGSNQGSHVLKAINGDSDRPAVRFSFCSNNTKEEIDYAVEKLKEMFLVKA